MAQLPAATVIQCETADTDALLVSLRSISTLQIDDVTIIITRRSSNSNNNCQLLIA